MTIELAILLDGVDITHAVDFTSLPRFTTRADGTAGDCKFRVLDKLHAFTAAELHNGATLELFINGTREWDGWVFRRQRGWAFDVDDTSNPVATPIYWAITGYDRNLLFSRRFIFDQVTPTNPLPDYSPGTHDDVVIAEYVGHFVDLTGDDVDVTSGITHVSSGDVYVKFTLAGVGLPWGTMFSDLAGQTGAIYWIGPNDRVLRYVDDAEVTAPLRLVDTVPGDGEVAYRDLDWGGDATQLANEAFVWGTGLGGGTTPTFAHYAAQDSIDVHGLWQWRDQFIGGYKEETLLRRATTYVEGSPTHHRGHKDDADQMVCTIYEPGLRAGMVVDVTSTVFDKHDTLPLRVMAISFPTPWDAQYDLMLGHSIDIPFAAVDPFWPTTPPNGPPAGGGWYVVDSFTRTWCDDTFFGTADNDDPAVRIWQPIGGSS